jgi:hypothetical protein
MHQRSVASLVALGAGLWLGASALAQSSPAAPATPPAVLPSAQPAQPGVQPQQDDPAQASFRGADTNKDGQLSREESARLPVIASRFAELDTNKDGQLSWEEFRVGYRAAP